MKSPLKFFNNISSIDYSTAFVAGTALGSAAGISMGAALAASDFKHGDPQASYLSLMMASMAGLTLGASAAPLSLFAARHLDRRTRLFLALSAGLCYHLANSNPQSVKSSQGFVKRS